MSTVLVLKNTPHEEPGLFATIMDEQNIAYDVIDMDHSGQPPDVNGYEALIVMGGPDSANDNTEKMLAEMRLIRSWLERDLPYFGVCLGLQTLVKAAGGTITTSEHKEFGLRDPDNRFYCVQRTDAGRADPLLTGIPDCMHIFHLHGETVDLRTDNMTLLGRGKWCENQLVRVGEQAYGIQGHCEVTPDMLENWLEYAPELIAVDKQQLRQDFQEIYTEYENHGRTLFTNFLKLATLIS